MNAEEKIKWLREERDWFEQSKEWHIDHLEQTREWYIGHLKKIAESLAMEETLDQLAWRRYYRWIIESFGTDEDKKKAGIKQEEEE
jgi:Uri superfamily endonuclease|tara:strand:- start:351 stop:608 length:258 start_codon:yes stop_codon:yes gene_type:complete